MYGVSTTGNNSLDLLRMQVDSARDTASQLSDNFRNAMEAMMQMAQDFLMMMAGIAQVLMKVLGVISG